MYLGLDYFLTNGLKPPTIIYSLIVLFGLEIVTQLHIKMILARCSPSQTIHVWYTYLHVAK